MHDLVAISGDDIGVERIPFLPGCSEGHRVSSFCATPKETMIGRATCGAQGASARVDILFAKAYSTISHKKFPSEAGLSPVKICPKVVEVELVSIAAASVKEVYAA